MRQEIAPNSHAVVWLQIIWKSQKFKSNQLKSNELKIFDYLISSDYFKWIWFELIVSQPIWTALLSTYSTFIYPASETTKSRGYPSCSHVLLLLFLQLSYLKFQPTLLLVSKVSPTISNGPKYCPHPKYHPWPKFCLYTKFCPDWNFDPNLKFCPQPKTFAPDPKFCPQPIFSLLT